MNIRKFTAALLALSLCVSLFCRTSVSAAQDQTTETSEASPEQGASSVATNSIPGWPQAPDISSAAAIVMDTSNNVILYGKNVDEPFYPAAAVKIMTVLLALENSSLDEEVVITSTGVSGATDGGANIAAQLDEVFTMEQCLYAIMMVSANDIAMQVAEHIGGSIESFVEMMNTRAGELGCTGTVFTNPTGLPDENQHVTAHDMALIMKEAVSNDTFRTIASAASYTISATNVSGGERALTNNFSMLDAASPVYYEGCLGGKEGATAASGSTLVCAAERDGMQVVAVILQNSNDQINAEAISILDYAFQNFEPYSVGTEDFNFLKGGHLIVPVGTTEEDLTVKDREKNGKIRRAYFFGGIRVGAATFMAMEEQDTSVLDESSENLAASAQFSQNKTPIPYYVIAAVGIFLLILLIRLLVKAVKS